MAMREEYPSVISGSKRGKGELKDTVIFVYYAQQMKFLISLGGHESASENLDIAHAQSYGRGMLL